MKYSYLLLFVILYSMKSYTQPSSTPASGYQWVLTGTGMYSSGEVSTTPGVPSDTSYGQPDDSDPASCSASCGGSCDGVPYIRKKVFGTTPGFPASSCEQRALNLNHWNNTFPASGVPNGATSGTVYLPTSSNVTIVQSPTPGSPGTGAGGDENYHWIIGGVSGDQSRFNVTVDWSESWSSSALGGFSGSQSRTTTGSFQGNDAGPGNSYQLSGGWINGGLGFGESFGQVFNIPTSNLPQTGGTFEVIFTANALINITIQWGNADGEAQHGPGMEGRASHSVSYNIWQIQPILPVKLVEFNAKKVQHDIVLEWATAMEINHSHFILQKSNNASDWFDLAKINADVKIKKGSKNIYSHIDKNTQNDENPYYRLLQFDADGMFEIFDPISIKNAKKVSDLVLYPNPAYNKITVRGLNTSVGNIEVIDLVGKIVLTTNETEIDISSLSQGIYFLRMSVENEVRTTKFIKN